MKFFIATDIHGSAYWAQKVLQKFNQTRSDVLVLLGDLYNHGPRNPFPQDYSPLKVSEIFNSVSNKIIWIQGNCDSEVDRMVSDFSQFGDQLLPTRNRRFYFTHGHVYNKKVLPSGLIGGDVMFYGHFHVSEITDVNGVICVNVGSAALPKDGINAYCIADEKAVTLYDFDDIVISARNF